MARWAAAIHLISGGTASTATRPTTAASSAFGSVSSRISGLSRPPNRATPPGTALYHIGTEISASGSAHRTVTIVNHTTPRGKSRVR
jgi:hypothetical protein